MNKRAVGNYYEAQVVTYLEKKGLKILNTNFRCYLGEIDIIARDKEYLVFVEVKYRKTARMGDPTEAVHYYKQRTITKVARYYLMKNNYSDDTPCRFDVVAIRDDKIKHLPHAFNAVY